MTVFSVSLEGPDLTGKSTIANFLAERLRELFPNKIIQQTAVPSNLITGFFPKVLRNTSDPVDNRTIALAYAADHLHHYKTIIEPLENSEKEYIIIQERSLLSTLIYQSVLGDADIEWVLEINKHDKNIPDVQIVLYIEIDELLKRKKFMKKDRDIYETVEHIKKQTEAYTNLPLHLTEKFSILLFKADMGPIETAKELAKIVKSKIEAKVVQQQLTE